MKKQLLVWVLWLLALSPALCQPTVNCPGSLTRTFNTSDISSGGGVSATKCQRIIPLNIGGGCSTCTSYTISFSNGSPAPAFLPQSTTQQTGFFSFATGQTVVTLTGTDGSSVASCTFAVTLIDDEPPIIVPPTPTTVTAKTASTVPDLRNLVQVDEDCDYTLTQSPAPGSPVSGTSVVLTFVATDASGNSSNPFEMTLLFSSSTEYDALTFTASGGCTGDGIAVAIGGLAPGTYSVIDKVDNQAATESIPISSSGNINYVASTGLSEGVHTITLLALTKDGGNPYFINRSASVYIGNPSASISNLLVSSTLGNGVCVVTIKGTASGFSFIFTGPNGYVFSNVFRNNGTYNIIADGVKEPGQYLLTASFPPNSCGTSTFTQTIDVGGVKCTD